MLFLSKSCGPHLFLWWCVCVRCLPAEYGLHVDAATVVCVGLSFVLSCLFNFVWKQNDRVIFLLCLLSVVNYHVGLILLNYAMYISIYYLFI